MKSTQRARTVKGDGLVAITEEERRRIFNICPHGYRDKDGCIVCGTDGAAESQGILPDKKPLSKPESEDDDESDPTKPHKLYDVSKSRLPLISVIDDQSTLNLARDLLIEAKEQDDKLYAATARLKEIKADLIDIAKGFSLPGFRHGDFGMDYLGTKTKKTLNKNRLIEKGVSPEDIADCYVDGKPFDDARFKRFLL